MQFVIIIRCLFATQAEHECKIIIVPIVQSLTFNSSRLHICLHQLTR